MTDQPRTTGDDRSQDTPADGFRRREFVALGAGATATMLAGCAGDGELTPSGGSDGSDGSETLTGNFRLLISDAPADIADFDQLNVTLDEARIFQAQDEDGEEEDDEEEDDEEEDDEEEDDEDDETDDAEADDEDEGTDQSGNETVDESAPTNGTAEEDDGDATDDENDATDDENEEADDGGDDNDEDDRGFTVVDLEDATVDLTQVIEDDAMAVFDGEIPAGSYEKIELSVTTVEGIVDGEEVDVKLPSEKLQITNGFEVTPDEPVSFVFDINVVKRGKNNGYILKPVIAGSGVAGRDVEVNEIDDEDGEDADDTDDGSGDAENGTATNETAS
ncbi:DUF4382 domain-containing protein [Halorubrum kocurii]|uniref:DUF4382 domain-containing protein n=1 Tax=Halorubrum kocurii JCM 14978 TaxID=1230456 RepID=M0PAI9_9EURY|nr:DUF4382 domain-containing protein [Halorubrum kocurii]EMA65850.1 hypothetical protein C468_05403 [Halorubrum kocurii JCM 14978]